MPLPPHPQAFELALMRLGLRGQGPFNKLEGICPNIVVAKLDVGQPPIAQISN